MQLDTHELVVGGSNPLDRVPGASDSADSAFWLAYIVVIVALLSRAVRRKQV